MSQRRPAVAGQFYDADPSALHRCVARLLREAARASARSPSPRALIVPHAGYVYSGSTAAHAYAALAQRAGDIRKVVLLGPSHRVYLRGMAVPSVDSFATPLGAVELDREGLEHLCSMPGVTSSDEAHRLEHSLEVQLPFLQTTLSSFTLLPVVVGECPAELVAGVIDSQWQAADTLLIISSDLSHYHSYQQAQQLDRATCEHILRRDALLSGQQACGAHALNGLMLSNRCRDLQLELLALCNSGDTAGDRERVVGYGAFCAH